MLERNKAIDSLIGRIAVRDPCPRDGQHFCDRAASEAARGIAALGDAPLLLHAMQRNHQIAKYVREHIVLGVFSSEPSWPDGEIIIGLPEEWITALRNSDPQSGSLEAHIVGDTNSFGFLLESGEERARVFAGWHSVAPPTGAYRVGADRYFHRW